MAHPLRKSHLSWKNKFARALWQVVWLFFFRPSPRPLHAWRCFLLRLFGAELGVGVHPYPSCRIWAPWNLVMEDHSCLSESVDCYNVDKIRIGKSSTVSQYSFLCAASHDYGLEEMPMICAPITIGSHVWVTADVFVGPGVTIGDGTVITARSSVFHDMPAWVVAKGNPAVPVRPRKIERKNRLGRTGNQA